MHTTLSTLAVLSLCLTACAESDDSGAAAATSGESDVEELARTSGELVDAVGDISTEVTLVSGTVPGAGDCVWAYEVSGTPSSGAITVALETTPCGGTVSAEEGSGSLDVTTGSLAGTYAVADEVVTLTLTGDRMATLALDTARRGTRAYDTSVSLTDLTATGSADGLGAWGMSLAYQGIGNRIWELDADGTGAGTVTGTLTGPGGSSCTVEGTVDDVTISCDDAP